MASKFRNAGQTCVCANRFLVQEGIYDRFVEALTAAARGLVVASGLTPGAQQGPLIDDAAVAKLDTLVAGARKEGAEVHCGGERLEPGSRFFHPTVLSVQPGMAILHEELFGPVAPVIRFTDEEEAIRIANETSYGLAAYFYGQDLTRVWRVIEALEFGIVGVNTGAVSVEVAPFGGVKQSGLGREGGKHGIEEFTELKYVCLGGMSK
jgi:succinate-semialdehyde dehydrogenase/glutarate-semialdehyde dehydrogenase